MYFEFAYKLRNTFPTLIRKYYNFTNSLIIYQRLGTYFHAMYL